MEPIQIDFLTVIIAAVLNMIIGFLWYSKWLFGEVWMRAQKMKDSMHHSKMPIVYEAIISLFIAYFLAFFISYMGVTTVSDGMFVAFLAWLGFVATTHISTSVWGGKPFKLVCIDLGYRLLSFLVMGGIIGA